ncbi:HAD family hydrolase [Planctomicrobium piriforme]|uniref:Putative hydrolase of the HAD superfamily n=1 Tax=Planctomicrobium piriforme TaxID=1576369 RepID=A0A1I3GTI5_9PLAN|nr:HAD-IIIA family hydrolase [Planctomicrobium piriforme]SFI26716.1 putative hydrolase of the HAD superfamily [Planctomicrobium piriforme]
MPSSSAAIRCVAFDAVGTLIHAEPSVSQAYQQVARKYGADVPLPVLRERFLQSMSSRPMSAQTSEATELAFWQATVQDVIGTVTDPEACFQELYDHFGDPHSWRLDPDGAAALATLAKQGIQVCIASNFDERLQRVVNGMPELGVVSQVLISSQVGWRKPHPRFFEALQQAVNVPPSQILMVGDDVNLDVVPARQLGMQALHLAPGNSAPGSIRSLTEVVTYCGLDG